MHDTPFLDLVKTVRRDLGLSQEELAHKVGFIFATLTRWENVKTVSSKLSLNQFYSYIDRLTKKEKSVIKGTINKIILKNQNGNQ